MSTWFERMCLLFVLASSPCWAAPPHLAGAWKGSWSKLGDSIPVQMTFEKKSGEWTGEFESDALQAAGIPLSVVRLSGNRLHFEINGDSSRSVFDGTINGNTLAGTFAEAGAKGRFRFARTTGVPPRIRTQDVAFRNGDVTLSGTLLLPRRPGRVPAVEFLQGSGAEGHWANRWLAQKFVEAGFAALIYDKRGVGQSTGDWRTTGFDDLARDAAAGVRFLRTVPAVDPHRIGIFGHSQGGSVAPLVDRDAGGLAFIIASAAPGLKPRDVERYSIGNSIGLESLPASERADAERYISAIIDVAYSAASRDTLEALAGTLKDRSWFFAPPAANDPYWTLSRTIASFDPSAAWSKVKAPVLLIYGLKDERVPTVSSLHAIETALAKGGNSRVSIKEYADADHIFTIVLPSQSEAWPHHETDYAQIMIAWAVRVTARGPAALREGIAIPDVGRRQGAATALATKE